VRRESRLIVDDRAPEWLERSVEGDLSALRKSHDADVLPVELRMRREEP
jgi:hypothetical protein